MVSLDLLVEISIKEEINIIKLPVKKINNILLGKIPIIVGSKYCVTNHVDDNECKYDPGGYAIINGNEKVLITQERIVPNKILIYKNNKQNKKNIIQAEIRSCKVL